ncbi:MAG: cytochrome P450 [Solirubrobacterales bacterium]
MTGRLDQPASAAAEEPPFLDLSDPAFSFRAAPARAARERSWYARTPYGIAVLRYEEARELLRDRRLGQGSKRWPEHNGVESGPFRDWWHRTLINLTGEDHKRQRRILNPAFAPGLIDREAPMFVALANELIDGFAGRGRCEFVAEFSQPYATRVICNLIGLGDRDWEDLALWTAEMGLALGITIGPELERVEHGLGRLTEYAEAAIAARRAAGGPEDTVGALIAATDAGMLSELELTEAMVNMFFGGVETTRNQLGIAVDLFAEHPDQWRLLGERPELAAAAVEEVMRMRPTTTWITREALEDLEYEGVAITRGTTIHLVAAVAGTDPRTFGADQEFDIARERPKQFGFGGGAHHCLGHFLARRDMTEALALLARRLPGMEADGEARWLPDTGNTGPLALPLRFAAEPAR